MKRHAAVLNFHGDAEEIGTILGILLIYHYKLDLPLLPALDLAANCEKMSQNLYKLAEILEKDGTIVDIQQCLDQKEAQHVVYNDWTKRMVLLMMGSAVGAAATVILLKWWRSRS